MVRNDVVKNFPAWAVAYLCGVRDVLSDDDCQMVQDYMLSNRVFLFPDTEFKTYFSNKPVFGEPCECCDIAAMYF